MVFFPTVFEFFDVVVESLFFFAAFVFFTCDAVGVFARVFAAPATGHTHDKGKRNSKCC
jgi:hypothetical protein